MRVRKDFKWVFLPAFSLIFIFERYHSSLIQLSQSPNTHRSSGAGSVVLKAVTCKRWFVFWQTIDARTCPPLPHHYEHQASLRNTAYLSLVCLGLKWSDKYFDNIRNIEDRRRQPCSLIETQQDSETWDSKLWAWSWVLFQIRTSSTGSKILAANGHADFGCGGAYSLSLSRIRATVFTGAGCIATEPGQCPNLQRIAVRM